ncbi:MAG TPA: ribosome-associated translation inhibitor RaiA [Candidatus Polarisedimenticolia bacterium]|nr:ribosome-associated translation inhibitor RaiA [Candidatus Polarisedimenticolia bacterium]
MKLDITGRNIEVTPAIREFAEEKLTKLERWIDDIMEAHLILSVEKHRHSAEILVKGRHHTFTGTEETEDMYVSIGNSVDKIEHQARRAKEKVTDRRKHSKSTHEMPPRDDEGDPGHETEAPAPSDKQPRIIRVNGYSMKPLSLEDAALKFLESDREFLVYRDARSQRINVMYRRKDGNLGLIEPES